MPNGFGSYIEKRDIRESKGIVEKYQGEVSKNEAEKDFKDAFFGNPSTWYADGLKLKESVRVFIEEGGTFKELLQSVQKEFEADGFTEQDAASVINRKLSEITKVNDTVVSDENTTAIPNSNEIKDERATSNDTPANGSSGTGAGVVGESTAEGSVQETADTGAGEKNTEVKPISIGKFDYRYDQGEWKATDKEGNPVSNKDIPKKSLHSVLKKWEEQCFVEVLRPDGKPMRYRAAI